MAELTTRAKVKEYLGVASTVTTWDTLITDLLEGAEKEIRRLCNKGDGAFATGARTEKRSGAGQRVIYLTHRPVTAITTVKVFTAVSTSTTTDSGDYRINDDATALLLQSCADWGWSDSCRRSPFWKPDAHSQVAYPYTEIIYTGGFTTIPDDLEEAARWYTAQLFIDKGTSHTKQSENLDKYGYTLATPDASGTSPRFRELMRRLGPFVVPS